MAILRAALVAAFLLFVTGVALICSEYVQRDIRPSANLKLFGTQTVEIFGTSITAPVHCSAVYLGNNLVLTAAHCTEFESKVKTDNGAVSEAKLSTLWASKDYDLALVETSEPLDAKAASLSCRPLSVGEDVHVIGNPGPFENMYVWGRVAKAPFELKQEAPAPSWRSLQPIDITGMGGNSGSPVYDRFNNVVGIISAEAGQAPFPLRHFLLAVPNTAICRLMGRA